MSSVFGYFDDVSKPYCFNGMPGWFTVPAGRTWFTVTARGGQMWVSPNAITLNADDTISGDGPFYAAELNLDGTLVYQDKMRQRQMGLDSPAPDRLSPLG